MRNKIAQVNLENLAGINRATTPGVFGVLFPLGLIELHTAELNWLLLKVGSVILSIALLLKSAGLRWSSCHGAILVVVCLLLGPFRMGIRQGQLDNMVLLFVLLAVTSLWFARLRIAFAILLGVAIALKPTSAGLFSIYLFCCRGRKLAPSWRR